MAAAVTRKAAKGDRGFSWSPAKEAPVRIRPFSLGSWYFELYRRPGLIALRWERMQKEDE